MSSNSVNTVADEFQASISRMMDTLYKSAIERFVVTSIGFMIFFYISHDMHSKLNFIRGDLFNTMYNIGLPEEKDDVFTNEINKQLKDSYMQPLLEFKQKKKNEIDEMGIGASFFYVLESSYIICINNINQINLFIGYMVQYNNISQIPYIGILLTYILFIILIKYNDAAMQSLFKSIFGVSDSEAQKYVSNIIFAFLSAFIFLYVLYFFISSATYLWYVFWGMFSIQSAQSSALLRFWYGILFIIPAMVIVKSMMSKEGFGGLPEMIPSDPQDNLPPCNKTSWLNQLFFLFIIPMLASLQSVLSLLKNGVLGIPDFFGEFDKKHKSIFYSIIGYALIFWLVYTVWPIVTDVIIPNFLSAIGADNALTVYKNNKSKIM
jgi:hypothetical protein